MLRMEILAGPRAGQSDLGPDAISDLVADPASLLWIDLRDPTPADFDLLAREFGFHPLALEDAAQRHERPKLDEYEHFLFIVFYAVRLLKESWQFATQEISLFVGQNYLVTVHAGEVPEVDAVIRRWKDYTDQVQSQRVAVLLYALLDAIVDCYFPVLDAIAERADVVEDAIFSGRDGAALNQIFTLRKELMALRRVLAPERDLMSILTRRDIELLGPDTAVFFQDVYDHVLRVTDAIDTYRDLLASALEAYLSVISNDLNQVMRTLTAWSIILMSLALIAGIYGMNYRLIPPSEWSPAFPFVLAGMTVLGVALFALFRRIRWL
ncbi:MAG: magnesium/cobalt transporter CorA [Sphaerobacter sp.]|nr:magnesium/cobalt transporter CorA [Sphaerobacter sp.]